MMKNTEWGAVAYLQHSAFGSHTSVRVNNNSSYLTGYASVSEPTCGYNPSSIACNSFGTASSVTQPYNTETGYLASTTGNITGVYDMSGGASEYIMGYNINTTSIGEMSTILSLYNNFFSDRKWSKYYDQYSVTSSYTYNYHLKILGDATGEMGPFGNTMDPDSNSRPKGSWYGDLAYFFYIYSGWSDRGGSYMDGIESGVFYFHQTGGAANNMMTFRVILTPSK